MGGLKIEGPCTSSTTQYLQYSPLHAGAESLSRVDQAATDRGQLGCHQLGGLVTLTGLTHQDTLTWNR